MNNNLNNYTLYILLKYNKYVYMNIHNHNKTQIFVKTWC